MTEMCLNIGNSPGSVKCGVWYSFTPSGSVPSSRVGHTATYLKEQRLVVFIGGAVPDGLRQGTFVLNLSNYTCSKVKTKGNFEYRYEHCAFNVTACAEPVEENVGGKIWVFGGANTEENKNDLWEFDVANFKWNKLTQVGEVPSERTLHWNAGDVEGLLVFGGGSRGVEAVDDNNTYHLDVTKKSWTIKQSSKGPPVSRHGHLLVMDSTGRLFFHGGINNKTFYDDLYRFEGDVWEKLDVSEVKPSARASHGGVIHCGFLYMFGGLTSEGVENDFWKMDITSLIWEKIEFNIPTFPPRLDFAMILVNLPKKFTSTNDNLEDVNSVEEYLNRGESSTQGHNGGDGNNQEMFPFILMHGGMDDKGTIYDDILVYKLST